MQMPEKWAWKCKLDYLNIRSIFKQFGDGRKISSFPGIGFFAYVIYKIRGIKWIPFLNYFDYKKDVALDILKSEYDYIPYPYKHYESVFTRFYQGYILPKKFNVDKRKSHLSCLIRNKEITRDDALKILEKDEYPGDFERDKNYFCKKLDFTQDEFDEILRKKPVSHLDFDNSEKLFKFSKKIFQFFFKSK